jgi:uncharacterized repeat protein (TIGR01451 family)
MNIQRFQISQVQAAVAAAVLTVGVAGLTLVERAYAAAAAGTSITNQATVTFEDSVGNALTPVTSNLASVTVAQVYAATMGADDLTITSGPAQQAQKSFTITNNGNGTDVFHISVADNFAGSTDTADFTAISAYLDGTATASGGTVTTNNCVGSNGVYDGTEVALDTAAGASINTVTIPAGQTACIIVVGDVPASALNGNTFEWTVTAQGENGNAGVAQANSVGDISDGNGAIGGGANGADSLDDTNNVRVTVTADASLNINKTILGHTLATAVADGEIEYRITVQNTGAADAREVFLFDGIPANTTFVPGSVKYNGVAVTAGASGSDFFFVGAEDINETTLDASVTTNTLAVDLNGDGDATDTTEADFGLDLDRSGAVDAAVRTGVVVYDHVIPPSTTVTMEFKVSYLRTLANTITLTNQAHFSSHNNASDDDTQDTGETKSSNDVSVSVPTISAVDIDDTDGDGALGNSDGTDEDADNDIQSVQTAVEGGTVFFNNVIQNNGNATDTLTVTVNNDGGAAWNGAGGTYPAVLSGVVGSSQCDGSPSRQFPAGTTFQIYDITTPTSPALVAGGVFSIAASATVNIQVRATLPSGVNGAGEYCASTLVSGGGGATDYKLERLADITAPAVDLANTDNSALTGDTESFPAIAAITSTSPVTNVTGNPGDTVEFDLWIRNDGGVAETFTPSAGSTWNGGPQGAGTFAAGVLGGLQPGWTVVFEDNDASTATADGTVITNTDLIPAGGAIRIKAKITIPASATATQADFLSDIDGDTTNDAIDDNADGDNDYPIIFRVVGNSSGSKDVVLDSVDVNAVESISITSDQTGQVEAGATVTYNHTIANNGNTTESVAISAAQSHPNFNPSLVRVDTNCDGSFNQVLAGYTGTVCLVGDTASTPTGSATAGLVSLLPGKDVSVEVTVSSQNSAAVGVSDNTVVTATWNTGGNTTANTDTTTIVTVSLDADKTAARDAGCDGVPDEDFTTATATATAPGECVIWQIVVQNTSSQAARNVVVQDAAQTFTTFDSVANDSLQSCDKDVGLVIGGAATRSMADMCTAVGGTACALTDADDADAGCVTTHDAHVDGTGAVTFYIGKADGGFPAPDDVTTNKGGTLKATGTGDDFTTVRFRVKLDL